MTKRIKRGLLFVLIGLIMYNTVVLCLAGLSGHTATFWLSYIFAMVAFITVFATIVLLEDKKMQMRDWLFRLPLIKHGAIYIGVATIVSILFMLLEKNVRFTVPLAVHILMLGVYIIFAISCITAKEMVIETDEKLKATTRTMKLLRVEAAAVTHCSKDAAVVHAFQKLEEQIRFSDGMSYPELEEMERKMMSLVKIAKEAAEAGENQNALEYCEQVTGLLRERNDRCRLLK